MSDISVTAARIGMTLEGMFCRLVGPKIITLKALPMPSSNIVAVDASWSDAGVNATYKIYALTKHGHRPTFDTVLRWCSLLAHNFLTLCMRGCGHGDVPTADEILREVQEFTFDTVINDTFERRLKMEDKKQDNNEPKHVLLTSKINFEAYAREYFGCVFGGEQDLMIAFSDTPSYMFWIVRKLENTGYTGDCAIIASDIECPHPCGWLLTTRAVGQYIDAAVHQARTCNKPGMYPLTLFGPDYLPFGPVPVVDPPKEKSATPPAVDLNATLLRERILQLITAVRAAVPEFPEVAVNIDIIGSPNYALKVSVSSSIAAVSHDSVITIGNNTDRLSFEELNFHTAVILTDLTGKCSQFFQNKTNPTTGE